MGDVPLPLTTDFWADGVSPDGDDINLLIRKAVSSPTTGSISDLLYALEKRSATVTTSGSLAQLTNEAQKYLRSSAIDGVGYAGGSIADYLISVKSRLPATGAADSQYWTSARAAHLDADISSRATQAQILSDATPFQGARIDATISSRSTLTQAQVLSDATPFPGARIDATISSRATQANILSDATPFAGAKIAQLDYLRNSDLLTAGYAANSLADRWNLFRTQYTDARAAHLDADISSRSTVDAAHYTTARGDKLDHLDADVSSRAPSSTALSTATWTNTRAANLDNLDATVSSRSTLATSDVIRRSATQSGASFTAYPTTGSPRYVVTSGNGAYGSWNQLESSLGADIYIYSINIASEQGGGWRYRWQLGTGGAGSESAVFEAITGQSNGGQMTITLPERVKVASGARLSARAWGDSIGASVELSLNTMSA